MKERERKKQPSRNSSPKRCVHVALLISRDAMQADRGKDEFDFTGFLDGRLVKLPPRPKPALMSAEEKRRFKNVRSPTVKVLTDLTLYLRRSHNGTPQASRVHPPPKELSRGGEFFSTNSPHGIIWANEGSGGCVVPLPSVVYNGKSQVVDSFHDKPIANHSYEFCGVDERGQSRTYHGTYRCIRVVATDWERLASLDQKVSAGVCCSLKKIAA